MSGSSEPGDGKRSVESFQELCMCMEYELSIKIPEYLKTILLLSGFDNILSLSSLSENDINALENIARSEPYYLRSHSQPAQQWSHYYWSISRTGFMHKEFEIPIGHRRLLLGVVAYLRKTYNPPKPLGVPEQSNAE